MLDSGKPDTLNRSMMRMIRRQKSIHVTFHMHKRTCVNQSGIWK